MEAADGLGALGALLGIGPDDGGGNDLVLLKTGADATLVLGAKVVVTEV